MITMEWEGKAIGLNQREGRGQTGLKFNKKEYNAFKENFAWSLVAANCSKTVFTGPVEVFIVVYGGYDWDNLLKPISDAIEMAGIVKDDKQIKLGHSLVLDRRKKGVDIIQIRINKFDLKWFDNIHSVPGFL